MENVARHSRKSYSYLVEQLLNSPKAFDIIQAVRILEHEFSNRLLENDGTVRNYLIGEDSHPSEEFIRIEGNTDLYYSECDIADIQIKSTGPKPLDKVALIRINLLQLFGYRGVFPGHLCDLAVKQKKQNKTSLLDFINLFQHRLASLSIRYKIKNTPELSLENSRKNLNKSHIDPIGNGLVQLANTPIGCNVSHIANYFPFLLRRKNKSPYIVKTILESLTGKKILIETFVGRWLELDPNQLDKIGKNVVLGRGAIIGRKAWNIQNKIKIYITPIFESESKYLEGRGYIQYLYEVAKYLVGNHIEVDFILKLKLLKNTGVTLDSTKKRSLKNCIGFGAMLFSANKKNNNNESYSRDILVSQFSFEKLRSM